MSERKKVSSHRKQINSHREIYGISLDELAKGSGLHKSYICRYLKGKHDNPHEETMELLSDAAEKAIKHRVKWCKRIIALDAAR